MGGISLVAPAADMKNPLKTDNAKPSPAHAVSWTISDGTRIVARALHKHNRLAAFWLVFFVLALILLFGWAAVLPF